MGSACKAYGVPVRRSHERSGEQGHSDRGRVRPAAYGPMASGMLQAYGRDWMLVLTVDRPGATFGYPIAQLHFG